MHAVERPSKKQLGPVQTAKLGGGVTLSHIHGLLSAKTTASLILLEPDWFKLTARSNGEASFLPEIPNDSLRKL